MSATVALWVLGPLTVFFALSLFVVFVGVRTRDLTFRSRMARPTPPIGRRALLVNVVVPAGESRSDSHAT
ncbi:MAG TPA: hypothetical protein VIL71_05825 [Spirillospora sp.]